MIDLVGRINELLAQKGWSNYELSKQTNISTNTIYSWNKSGSMPSLANIVKICDVLGISLGQFFCGTEGYSLTDDEKNILREWFSLSDLEKDTIRKMIDTFKILKS